MNRFIQNMENVAYVVIYIVFWGIFITCLGISVPHMAWTLGIAMAGNNDEGINIMAYLFAAGLETMIFLLTFLLFRRRQKWYIRLVCYGFVVTLCLFSYYLNTVYSHHFYMANHNDLNGAESIPFIDSFPYVASAFPIFSPLFAIIAQLLGSDSSINIDAVRAANDERLALAQEKKRIHDLLVKEGVTNSVEDAAEMVLGTAASIATSARKHIHFTRPRLFGGKRQEQAGEEEKETRNGEEKEIASSKRDTQPLIPRPADAVEEEHQQKEKADPTPTPDHQDLPTVEIVDKNSRKINGTLYYTLARAANTWSVPRSQIERTLKDQPMVSKQYTVLVRQGQFDVTYISTSAKSFIIKRRASSTSPKIHAVR